MNRTDLTEKQWQALEPHLPADPHRSHAFIDHRTVLNGILWRLKTEATWRDIPARYGAWQTCYDGYVRWSRNGTWHRILKQLQAQADAAGQIDWDGAALDSTHIKAHRSAAGARKSLARAEKRGAVKDEWLGHSRGGWTSKIARHHRLAKGARGDRPTAFEAEAYKGRNVVERGNNRIKDFHAVAPRYDKRGHNYFACVLIATIILWLI